MYATGPALRQFIPIHIIKTYIHKIHFNINNMLPSSAKSSHTGLSEKFPTKLIAASPIQATCPAHNNLHEMTILQIYKSVRHKIHILHLSHYIKIQGYTQKFPDWPPGVRTAIGTALCH
jgi:hypothetical protein